MMAARSTTAGFVVTWQSVDGRVYKVLWSPDLIQDFTSFQDGILFPMADRMLDPETSRSLGAAFDHFECSHVGHGVHERMHDLAHSLMEGAA